MEFTESNFTFLCFGFSTYNVDPFLVKVIVFLCQDLRHGEETNTIKCESYLSFRILYWAMLRDVCEQDGNNAGAVLGGIRIVQAMIMRILTRGCENERELVESNLHGLHHIHRTW